MKKLIASIVFIFITLSLSSCTNNTKKTVYFTSEFSGYIYDSKTKLPLKNAVGFIQVNGVVSYPNTKLDENGRFFVPAKKEDYYTQRPSIKNYLNTSGDLFFSFPNYQTQRIEYADLYVKQVPEERAGFDHLNKIDLGIIYLDRTKEVNE
jgi:hypothetical protein